MKHKIQTLCMVISFLCFISAVILKDYPLYPSIFKIILGTSISCVIVLIGIEIKRKWELR